MNKVGITITKQGKPIIADNITILETTDNFIIGCLSVETKWCFVEEFSGSNQDGKYFGFTLYSSERTKEKYGWDLTENEYEHGTSILFTGLDENWNIFMIECSRYDLNFVLRKGFAV